MNKTSIEGTIASQRSRAMFCGLVLLGVTALPASAETISRSMEISGAPAAVWSAIGPFCAIKDWLPPVGSCTEDGNSPPTRTLVTKDGKATFVELQTARNDEAHQYSYSFKSTPLPVTNYNATIKVEGRGAGASIVTWSASYTPDQGKAKDASDALAGIYESGLGSIKAKFAN